MAERIRQLAERKPVPSHEAFAAYVDGSSLGFGWRGVGVWNQTVMPARDLVIPPLDTHHVVVAVAGEGEVLQQRLDGQHEAHWRPGDFCFLPRGTACGWRFQGALTLAHIDISAAFFRNVCIDVSSCDPNQVRFSKTFLAHDEEVLTLARWLLREITDKAVDGPAYAESIGVLVTVHILRAFAHAIRRVDTGPGALPKPRLRRVLAYLEDNLSTPISVEAMASVADYSMYHFARAFKCSTGFAPRQYQLRMRVDRASDMLRRSAMPLSDVADACGFSSPSHMARAFSKVVGRSPSKLRNEED